MFILEGLILRMKWAAVQRKMRTKQVPTDIWKLSDFFFSIKEQLEVLLSLLPSDMDDMSGCQARYQDEGGNLGTANSEMVFSCAQLHLQSKLESQHNLKPLEWVKFSLEIHVPMTQILPPVWPVSIKTKCGGHRKIKFPAWYIISHIAYFQLILMGNCQ